MNQGTFNFSAREFAHYGHQSGNNRIRALRTPAMTSSQSSRTRAACPATLGLRVPGRKTSRKPNGLDDLPEELADARLVF
jgi:hypothetical protein